MTWTVPEKLPGFDRLPPRPAPLQAGLTFYPFRRGKLTVLVSVDDYSVLGDGVWGHCSLARPDRDPTWAEIKIVRDAVFGPEALVVQVLAPASKWLNVNSHCFHLWHRLDDWTVPTSLWDQVGADGSRYTGGPR
jgi:hypothetical protein